MLIRPLLLRTGEVGFLSRMTALVEVKQMGQPVWSDTDVADLRTAAQRLRDSMMDGVGACRLFAVDAAHMQSLPKAAGWHLRQSDGITEAHGFCFATGLASRGDVGSTVLLPERLARVLVEHIRSKQDLQAATREVRYAHYVAAHEQGHSVDYHYRFNGQQTASTSLAMGAIRLEPMWRAMASKLISELCADGYAAGTISSGTYQDRVDVQNRMLDVYWTDLAKDFGANPGAANCDGRTAAAASFVLRVMLCHVHAVAGHIADSRLTKPTTLWSPPRKNLAEPRGFMTNWLRDAWDARRTAQASSFETKSFETARLFAKKLGFEFKPGRSDEQSDWLVGPAGGFR